MRSTLGHGFSNYLNADELTDKLKAAKGTIEWKDILQKYPIIEPNDWRDFWLNSSFKVKTEESIANSLVINTMVSLDALYTYLAAALADFLRWQLIRHRMDLSFETVMSHKSKLALLEKAKEDGYKIYLYFVCLDSADLNVERVHNRFRKGGHNVPEDKIRSRYLKTLANLQDAFELADTAYLFDNSFAMRRVLTKVNNTITYHLNPLPNWVQQNLPLS